MMSYLLKKLCFLLKKSSLLIIFVRHFFDRIQHGSTVEGIGNEIHTLGPLVPGVGDNGIYIKGKSLFEHLSDTFRRIVDHDGIVTQFFVIPGY